MQTEPAIQEESFRRQHREVHLHGDMLRRDGFPHIPGKEAMLLQMLLIAGALGAGPDGAQSQAVLLSFTQANCAPCRAMEPILAELEASGLAVQQVSVEQHPDFARRFQLEGTPTFVMTIGGRETARVVGVTSGEKLRALFPGVAGAPAVRGQSPETPNHLSNRLAGLLGKGVNGDGDDAGQASTPQTTDPFTNRQFGERRTSDTSRDERPVAKTAEYIGPAPANDNPQARAMSATVRLRVEEPQGQAIGTGTIVDTQGGEALLVTCAHIFRDSKGKGRIQVEVFHPQPRTVEGTLIDYNLERDIAVVSIKAEPGTVSAPIAPTGLTVNKQDAAFTVGCDKGADPTIRQTKITNLNRYVGPPNIEAAGEPTIGRSGGGLFNRDGYLIGVCNCADAQDDEGIYAATASIHWQLDKVGMADLFKPENKTPAAPLQPAIAVNFEEQDAREVSPRATASQSSAQDDWEIIAIVRPRSNTTGKGNVIVIPKASQQLLQQIAADSADPTTAADLALTADRRSSMTPAGPGPIVRGQSRR